MIDLHCHILPGLDDGAHDLQESLDMAAMALKDGIDTIVATPHTLDGLYANSREEVSQSVEAFRTALSNRGIEISICPGADVHLCPGMVERIKEGRAVTINNSGKYLLLELPPQNIPPQIKDEIFSLKLNGITPIITHPERHPAIQRDLGILHQLVSMGALAQVTAMSVTGEFGLPIRACAQAMLERRLIHVIATDAHSVESRPPILSRAVEAAADVLGSVKEADDMVNRIPALILSGEPVDVSPPGQLRRHR